MSLKYNILMILFFWVTINTSYASEKDLFFQVPTNQLGRRTTSIDHVVTAKMSWFAALAEPTDVTCAFESKKRETYKGVVIFGSGLNSPPEKEPIYSARRLEYLSTWLATVVDVKTLEGKELPSQIVIIGRETGAFRWSELPQNLFGEILKSGEIVTFGINKVQFDKVKKVISNLVVWRKDKKVFYQEAVHKKNGEEGQKLWEDIKTLNLPKDDLYYVIVDVGIGEKGKKKILDRFEKEREFRKRMEELEKRTNVLDIRTSGS